jgi:soluble lytic murein transglycosylase-like protein
VARNIFLVASCVFCLAAPTLAGADSGSVSPQETAGAAPRVLSPDDARRYHEIFTDEMDGRFAEARALITDLSDRSLIGYVEAEHYLSPHSTHAAIGDLAQWLATYAELPVAERIRALAELRNHRRRHKVLLAGLPGIPRRATGGYDVTDSLANAPLASDEARSAQVQIDADVKLDQPAAGEVVLQQLTASNIAPASDITRLTQRLAASYLAEGQDDAALRIASSIAGVEREGAPLLDWDAGLAAYRLNKFADAAPYFEHLAQSGAVPGWTRSAAAFWAARSHVASGDPLPVVSLLSAAAREQPTFYGMLAQRLLGQEPSAAFSDPVLDSVRFDEMMQIPAAHRAVALWQIGHTEGVQQEMSRAFAEIDLRDADAFAALSQRLDLPDLELRASEAQAARGELLSGLFPVPGYTPPGGYHIDRCLLLAFVRVESRFQPHAVSMAGARGVMQVMPGTAQQIDGATPGRSQLNDPAYNLGLGERYLQQLLDQTNGNLFQLAAAYNAGPGALTRWLGTRPGIANDPLLFIESLPYAETRNYIKHVMTYYWMYARRTNEAAPSLQETAEGKWPLYRSNAALPVAAPASNTPQPATARTLLVSDASAPH